MSDEESLLALRKDLEARKARALEEVAAIDQKLADIDLLQQIAVRHGFVVTPPATRMPVQTVADLIESYCTDAESPYQKLRFATRRNYKAFHKRIIQDFGNKKLADIKVADIQNLYQRWTDTGKIAMTHQLAAILRVVVNYGGTVREDAECQRVSGIMHNIRLPDAAPTRKAEINRDQVIAIIQTANAHGRHSLALAQALQFEVSLRQKDIIGEWVPQSEPGVSDILNGNKKWLYGIRWDGLDNLVLHHTTSWEQKEIAIDLRNKMLVMTELTRPGIRKASGAIIVDEDVKRPYDANKFRKLWREIATEAGVPKDVRNMDSYDRSYGAASEHQETKVMK